MDEPIHLSRVLSPDDIPSMVKGTNFSKIDTELSTNASFVGRFNSRDQRLLPRIREWTKPNDPISTGDPNVRVELDGMKIKRVSCVSTSWDKGQTAMHAVAKAYEGKTLSASLVRTLGDDMFAAYRRQFMTERERDDETIETAATGSDFDAIGIGDELRLVTSERFSARFGDPEFDPRAKDLLSRIGTETPGMKITLNGARIKTIQCAPDRWNVGETAMRETAKAYEGKAVSTAVLRDLASDMHAAFKKQLLRPDELRKDHLETLCRDTDFQASEKDTLLSSSFFLDRFRGKALVERMREWAKGAGPYIRVHLNGNAMKRVEVITYGGAWEKGGTAMHDVAKRFEGKPLTVEMIRSLGDEMHAALNLEFEDKGPLYLSSILPSEWRVHGSPSNWSNSQTETAQKWSQEVKGKGQKLSELPETLVKKTVRRKQRLQDGATVSIDSVSDKLITCTVTRMDGRKEAWGITGGAMYREKADGKINARYTSCILFLLDDFRGRKAVNARPLESIALDDGSANLEQLARETKDVLAVRHNEETDPGRVRRFEMPTKEPMGYIGLCDTKDKLVAGVQQSIKGMPSLLAQQHELYCAPGCECINAAKKKPADIIREKLRAYRKAGIFCAYINIAAHGSEDGLKFPGGLLRPDDLSAIFREFSGMLIIVNALSCLGGNLASVFSEYKRETGERDKVVFLHTKSDTLLNSVQIGQRFDSAYNVFLSAALAKGMSYMDAHHEADEMAKLYDGSNAEVWIARTGGNDRLSAAPDAGRPPTA